MVLTRNTACGTETVPHLNNSEKRHRRDTHVAFLWWNFNFFVNFLRTFGELFAANANRGFFGVKTCSYLLSSWTLNFTEKRGCPASATEPFCNRNEANVSDPVCVTDILLRLTL